ncbi:MAG: DUF2169 domain-containing protein [Myxococcota bacterium]|nr:DUF2169 domain-containing protein [Myxococcota bacterium]
MFERSRYKTGFYPTVDAQGAPTLLVVVKRTYAIDVVEARCDVADEQDDIALGDEFDGTADPFESAVQYESDLAPWKLKQDVIFHGKAYAPGGTPSTEWDVSLRVGQYRQDLRIFGPRTVRFVPPGKAKKNRPPEPQPPLFSKPAPVETVELTYRNAYGGIATFYPEDPTAFRRAVRKAKKKEQKKQEDEAKAALDAAAAKEAEFDAATSPEENNQDAAGGSDLRSYFFHGIRDISNAPEEELEIELGSRRLKSSEGTMILDLAELWEAEQREAREEQQRLAEQLEASVSQTARDHDGTERIDEARLADEAKQLTEAYLEERREYQVSRHANRQEDGARGIERADQGDEILADDAWIEVQRRERVRYYESLGLDPDEEVEWTDGEFPRIPCPTNFVGKGFALRNCRESLDGLQLPQIENPRHLLKPEDIPIDPATLHLPVIPQPAGFGFVSRSWSPRSHLSGFLPGELDEQQLRQDKQLVELDPNNPEQLQVIQSIMDRTPQVMDPRVHNAAPLGWQVEHLAGDEDVFLENLDASGKTYFKLPGAVPYTRLDRGDGWERVDVSFDTLVIDREAEKLWMVWRGALPMRHAGELAQYPHVEIDIQDMGITEWRDLLEREAIERRRRAGEALKLGVDEITEEQLVEFERRIQQAGIGLHGIRESRDIDASEPRASDGALIEGFDREDVILNDGSWVEQARIDAMTADERRAWELAQSEKAAVAEKKRHLKERVEEIEKQKALEAKKASKRKQKKAKQAEVADDEFEDTDR